MKKKINRRNAIKTGAVSCLGASLASYTTKKAIAAEDDRRFLIVVTATGGGSIIDSFLPIQESSINQPGLSTYTSQQIFKPEGSEIATVHPFSNLKIQGLEVATAANNMVTFLENNYQNTAILCHEVTSVNHEEAQKRAMNGNSANRGETILEAVARRHGNGLLIPSCNMSVNGYAQPGQYPKTPESARPLLISNPKNFAFTTHASKGVLNAPDESLLNRARKIRGSVEKRGQFWQTFQNNSRLSSYIAARNSLTSFEEANLIEKLMIVKESEGEFPLDDYGLNPSPLLEILNKSFPNLMFDAIQAQAALAYLLLKGNISSSVAIGPSFNLEIDTNNKIINPPLSFDFSHSDHRNAQNFTWHRLMGTVDSLIALLKATNYKGNPELGTLWERTLIYIATDFGRDKILQPSGGSGHHTNNASVIISPLIKGNKIYGGIDEASGLTYGFDLNKGNPTPGINGIREPHIYSLITQAMGIEFPNQINMSAVIKS
ncbi:MAG: hypothetical protein R3B45_13310 [Bdellovibrionota bacterium]